MATSGYELTWFDHGYLAAAAMMLVLAGALLFINFRDRLNRAFALFLALRGTLNIVDTFLAFPGFREPTAVSAFYSRLHPWVEIAVVFATAHFVIAYYDRYVAKRTRPWVVLALLAGVLLVEGLYAFDHRLYADSPGGQLGAEGTAYGPLFVVSTARNLGYAVVAALFLRHAEKEPVAPLRSSFILLGVGFLLEPLSRGVAVTMLTFIPIPTPLSGFAAIPWWDTAGYLLSLVPLALAIASLARLARGERLARRTLPIALGLVAFIGLFPLASGAPVVVTVAIAVDIFSLVALPVLATYALLRHQLFDLDVKLKWTLGRGTLAGLFVAVFLVATQLAENILDDSGLIVGGVATGLMLFALTPLQRLAERVADGALPGVKSAREMDADERRAVYSDQVRFAWSDGRLDTSERALLSRLRDRLGLDLEEAVRIEEAIAQEPSIRGRDA